MIYITGDTHGDFTRIKRFCKTYETSVDDIIIILGDAGINYYGGKKDRELKKTLSKLPITIFSIHGNHEIRPSNIKSYKECEFNNGTVYKEDAYPNLLFAKDGEIYDFDGIKTLVIGGAYSVDKYYRLKHGYGWWPDEQPSDKIKSKVEKTLFENHYKTDVILSHTVPFKYEPVECFLPGIDQSTVDKSTEEWLDTIEDRTDYKKWYCGHWHTQKQIDKIRIMFGDIVVYSI